MAKGTGADLRIAVPHSSARRRVLLFAPVLLAIALAGLHAEASAEDRTDAGAQTAAKETPPSTDWQVASAAGAARLRQLSLGEGVCRLQCFRGSQLVWSAGACIGRPDQPVFVSEDGEAIIVLEPSPTYEEGAILRSEVGRIYSRDKVGKRVLAAEIVKDPDRVPRRAGRLGWLQGAETSGAGAVRITAIDGQVRRLRFDGEVEAEPKPASPPPTATPGHPPVAAAKPQWQMAQEKAEDSWRARFRTARERVAAEERRLLGAREERAKLARDGAPSTEPEFPPPPADSNISVPVRRDSDGCIHYSGGEILCPKYTQRRWNEELARWQDEQMLRTRRAMVKMDEQIAQLEERVKRAKADLDELDRRASLEGVPFEWRK